MCKLYAKIAVIILIINKISFIAAKKIIRQCFVAENEVLTSLNHSPTMYSKLQIVLQNFPPATFIHEKKKLQKMFLLLLPTRQLIIKLFRLSGGIFQSIS